MIEFLNSHIEYWHWIVFGIILAVSEILVPSFVMLLLGVAAIVVGILVYSIDLLFSTQLIVWLVLSSVNTLAWFKFVMPRIKTKSFSGMAREEVVGAEGMVINFDNEVHKGQVRFTVPLLGQAEWSVISDDRLDAGDNVRVNNISGNSLIVSRR